MNVALITGTFECDCEGMKTEFTEIVFVICEMQNCTKCVSMSGTAVVVYTDEARLWLCESAVHCVAQLAFTALLKSNVVGRPRGPGHGCGCLNILLPVGAIYNVPVHGTLSAVSNLHLQEHSGSEREGSIWRQRPKHF